MTTINEELTYLEETKSQIKQAIIDKGQEISENDSFRSYVDKIEAIESGGTPVSVEEKDVNFYDYDGTRLYSYTLAEIQTLTELPALPSHTGLTCQGWNWTLADIKNENKETDVGAMYITDDGKTRLHINIETEYRTTVSVCFRQSVANGVELDWGDGSAVETFNDSGSTTILRTHTYTNIGEYVITLNPLNDCQLSLGNGTTSYNVLGTLSNMLARTCLKSIFIGKNVTLDSYVFSNCNRLVTLTMPANTQINTYAFAYNSRTEYIILPTGLTLLSARSLNAPRVYRLIFPGGITVLGQNLMTGDGIISKITLPSSISSLANYSFSDCNSLTYLIIPKNINVVPQGCFYNCVSMKQYDFSLLRAIPSLTNVDAFQNIPSDCKIVVPDNLYENWISKTNWSNYASYIIKKSDWEASQI